MWCNKGYKVRSRLLDRLSKIQRIVFMCVPLRSFATCKLQAWIPEFWECESFSPLWHVLRYDSDSAPLQLLAILSSMRMGINERLTEFSTLVSPPRMLILSTIYLALKVDFCSGSLRGVCKRVPNVWPNVRLVDKTHGLYIIPVTVRLTTYALWRSV